MDFKKWMKRATRARMNFLRMKHQARMMFNVSDIEFNRTYNEILEERKIGVSSESTVKKPFIQGRTQTKDRVETVFISPFEVTDEKTMAEISKIDLDYWYADKIVSNIWGNPKYPCWQFKVWWRRKTGITLTDAVEAYKELIQDYTPPELPDYSGFLDEGGDRTQEAVLVVPSVYDPHLGQLSWSPETRDDNYNLKIGCKDYYEAHKHFAKYYADKNIDTVLLPIGNDLMNCNGESKATVKGTPQDEDTRWAKTYQAVQKLIVDVIELWRPIAKNVRVVIVRANHDGEVVFYLGSALEMFYRYVDAVKIDNRPSLHKYHRFGTTLLGYTHQLKKKDNPDTLFVAHASDMMSGVKFLEYHTGHNHDEMSKTQGKTIHRRIPSLAPLSAWASSENYTSLRRAMCFVFGEKTGITDIKYFSR